MNSPALARLFICLALASSQAGAAETPPEWSGIYPHLAYANEEGECGTGAVVPWAGKLWAITYAPHKPLGSSDKLYEIDEALRLTVRPESIGGTPANRLIHRESGQLFIGPYVIAQDGAVRVIPYSAMPGRHTATARHLTDPAGKVYYATMEEGFYEVDVKTLEPRELYKDAHGQNAGGYGGSLLPGYHGKGCYSAQGVLVYANNGEYSEEARKRADIPSGVLAEWNGKDWSIVRRNQFTEVTGPGGIEGGADAANDPLWSIGWDHRSLILMMLDGRAGGERWHTFRLPKASHSYDGAHGWNTEWPRIREVGEANRLLMTMHGTFWNFPRGFAAGNTAGIAPRSSYLKVVGDFARWGDRIAFGCDDAAKSEFVNTRKAKGKVAGPGRSQSNLWFAAPGTLDRLGPVSGRGAVWLNDPVTAGQPSDAYLFSGYARRAAHLVHDAGVPVKFAFEADRKGDGKWEPLREVIVPAAGDLWLDFPASAAGTWIRVRTDRDLGRATVHFAYSSVDDRSTVAAPLAAGLASGSDTAYVGGLLRAKGGEGVGPPPLSLAAVEVRDGAAASEGYYEMGMDMALRRVENPKDHAWLQENAAIPQGVLQLDAASVLYVNEAGKRFRLPRGDAALDAPSVVPLRVDREVATERDLFHAHGTFYELPSEMAGGFSKIRPVTTHNRRITDYCSWRGLMVMSGISAEPVANRHIIRSDDGKAAVWVGNIDDLWSLGKPVGTGGPWAKTAVKSGEVSDAYLMSGYDRKTVNLSHDMPTPVPMLMEVDITGNGDWRPYKSFPVGPGGGVKHAFPDSFQAYWVRATARVDCQATALFTYE